MADNEPTPLDLDAIKTRAERASPGPWVWRTMRDVEDHWVVAIDDQTVLVPEPHTCAPHDEFAADRALIAHARTDIPLLVAEVERLRAFIGSRNP